MDSSELQQEIKRAEELFSKGMFQDARVLYEGLREFGDENPDIFVRLGDIAVKLNDNFSAMEDYKLAAGALSKGGSAIKAIAICKKIFSLHPSREHVGDNLATLSSHLKTSEDKGEAGETGQTASAENEQAQQASEASASKPLMNLPDEQFLNDILDRPRGSVDLKGARRKSELEEFDEFIDDYVKIVEHVEEDSLSVDSPNAKEKGLKRTPLFSDLSIDELMNVICKMEVCFVDMGDYVFRKGEEGQSIFVITSGAAEVLSYTKYGEEVKCATLTDGDFFGVHEYFSGTERRTDVRAVTDMELFEIKRDEMASITKRNPYMAKVLYDFYKERVLEKAMALSKVFKHMSIKDRKDLLETVAVESYPPGTDIVKYNEKGDTMFLVVSGTVEVWKLGAKGEKVSLANLQENDYFGEVALMLDHARTSNVSAVTTVDAIVIGRKHLEEVFLKYPIVKKVLEGAAKKHVRDIDAENKATEG